MSRWLVGTALSLALGCGSSAGSQAAAAAVTVATHVAAAAINRAATGECWAVCDPGYGCDEDSGTCVPLAELEGKRAQSPEEEAEDAGCIIDEDGFEICPDDPVAPSDPLEHVADDDPRPLEEAAPPPPDRLEGVESLGPDPLEAD
jgi:hypothetical protein